MERIHIAYSFKNILLPGKQQYKLALMNKIESFIANMWEKSYFFLTNNSQNKSQDIKNHCFKTNKHPSHMKEFDKFEDELISLVRLIKY